MLLQVALTVSAAALGAYFGEYLKTKGKNLATKEDFESLKGQLRENTELVENIKAEVGQRDWAAREWRNIRRAKLEEMLTKMHDSENYSDRFRNASMEGVVANERDPIGEMETLGVLYFPELKPQIDEYVRAHRQHSVYGAELVQGLLSAGDNSVTRQTHYDKFLAEFPKRTAASAIARNGLNAAARQLIVEIVLPAV
jgi:hypothetical protein